MAKALAVIKVAIRDFIVVLMLVVTLAREFRSWRSVCRARDIAQPAGWGDRV
jgi:hypothetical protein